MGRVVVLPARRWSAKGDESLAAARATAANVSAIYIIQPIDELPTINVTRTLAGIVAGRKRARQADAWAVRIATRWRTLWHVLGFCYVWATALLFVTKDPALQGLEVAATVVLMVPVLGVHGAALCWDLLLLLAKTFEFWFLLVVITGTNAVLSHLFRDFRVLAVAVGGASCMLPVFLDANLHLRTLILRLFVAGAPCLLFIIATVNFQLTPNLDYRTATVWGVDVSTVDLIVNGTFTTTFFMVTRVFRYRRLIFVAPGAAVSSMVQCDIFFPVCRLVPYDEWTQQRRSAIAKSQNRVAHVVNYPQLELVEQDQLRIVDARDTVVRFRWCSVQSTAGRLYARLLTWVLGVLGVAGCGGMLYLAGCELELDSFAHSPAETETNAAWHLAALGCSTLFILIHAANFQRDLAARICFQIDAWFVSFQVVVVALGTCDVFLWDRRSLLVLAVLLWCHWMVFLDALPPVTRRRLGLPRAFVVAVNLTLFAFPIWLGYLMFYAANKKAQRNRVMFRATVGQMEVRLEMFSFLASRIFTSWVWMGRFLWRELRRPTDSFKLIKYRVHFPGSRIGP